MQELFDAIATSKSLQALTIIITFASFFIFVSRFIFPVYKFCKTLIGFGYQKAIRRFMLPINRTVRNDAADVRKIIANISINFLRILVNFITLFLLVKVVERDIIGHEVTYANLDVEWWAWAIAVPISFAITYVAMFPIFYLFVYLHLLRRTLDRSHPASIKDGLG